MVIRGNQQNQRFIIQSANSPRELTDIPDIIGNKTYTQAVMDSESSENALISVKEIKPCYIMIKRRKNLLFRDR